MSWPGNNRVMEQAHAAADAFAPSAKDAKAGVTVVLVTYNSAHLLQGLFESLKRAMGHFDWTCVVIDNASRDGSAEIAASLAREHRLIRNPTNVGFARANNQAVPYLRGKYALLLNPDVVLPADAVSKTVAFMEERPDCGILGVKLIGPDGAVQPSCRYFPTPLNLFVQRSGLRRFFPRTRMVDEMDWDHAQLRSCDWVPGCFYLVRKEVIDEIGLFDPRYFLYYEEVDHCRAAKHAGWEVMFYPDVSVMHIGGESARSDGPLTHDGRQIEKLNLESEMLYFRKNHGAAGLWAYAVLMSIACVLTACKRLFKRHSRRAIDPALLWSTLFRTSWGRRGRRGNECSKTQLLG